MDPWRFRRRRGCAVTRQQLRARLDGIGPMPRNYSLDGPRDDALCPEEVRAGEWRVYYFERGIRRDDVSFESEAGACEYFRSVVENDPSYLS